MLYLRRGHPWRSLLQSDKNLLETWKSLDIWHLISQDIRNAEENSEELDKMQEKIISDLAHQSSLNKEDDNYVDVLNVKKLM